MYEWDVFKVDPDLTWSFATSTTKFTQFRITNNYFSQLKFVVAHRLD